MGLFFYIRRKSAPCLSSSALYRNVIRAWIMGTGLWMGMGQITAQTLSQDSSQVLSLSFRRQNNFTYFTQLGLGLRIEKPRYRLQAQLHHDNLYNDRLSNPFVQVYVQSSIWQYFRLHKQWEIASWLETDQFFNTQNQRYSLYLGAQYQPFPALQITPLIGYSWDYRAGRLDQGISPALQLKSAYQWADGSTLETDVWVRTKNIAPRHQRNVSLRSSWSRVFGEFAAISVGAQVGSNEMDDYKANSIERIKADTLAPYLILRYQLFPGVFWDSENRLSLTRRRFDYDPFTIEEAEFNDLAFGQTDFATQQRITFRQKKGIQGFLSYTYQFLNRAYELENSQELPEQVFDRLLKREQQKDYFRKRSSLELRADLPLTRRHTLSLIGTNRYLQYDTPSEENFDDHDELNYGLSLSWKSQWSRQFSTQYRLLGLVRRYAFLLKERSQDNYTQRSLRLNMDFRWQIAPRLNLRGEQFVYVTYNVKDFTDRNLTDRSTRNLESRISLTHRASRRWDAELELYRKEVHVSYLNWQAFSETTLDTTTTYILRHEHRLWLNPQANKKRWYGLMGYKHFTQLRFLNTSMNSLKNILTPINLHIRNHQTGPVTGLRFLHPRPAFAELSIWWQFQLQDYKFKELAQLASLTNNYQERELLRSVWYFRPFVNFKVNVNLSKQ